MQSPFVLIGLLVLLGLGSTACGAEPADPVAFQHARVTDVWEAYADKLTFGKGQTLALLDDGCKLSMPEWSQSDGDLPKVRVSYDSVDGDDDPKHEGRGVSRFDDRDSFVGELPREARRRVQ